MKKEGSFRVKEISLEVQENYIGRHVAIVNGKVVGWGATVKEAYRMTKDKFPDLGSEEILLRYIPREELLIL